MSRASNNDQFKFLISCIRWSNGGKVNFGEVAAECDIVSKGAAAKRYERMMKAHGIAPNAASTRSYSTIRDVKSEFEKPAHTPVSKKRKTVEEYAENQGNQDDDESFARSVKQDPELNMEELQVKEEPNIMGAEDGTNGDILGYSMTSMVAEDVYTPGGSYFEPSPGYHTPANDFADPMGNDHLYDVRGSSAQFMNFSNYQEHLDTETPGTLVSRGIQYQDDHIIIAD